MKRYEISRGVDLKSKDFKRRFILKLRVRSETREQNVTWFVLHAYQYIIGQLKNSRVRPGKERGRGFVDYSTQEIKYKDVESKRVARTVDPDVSYWVYFTILVYVMGVWCTGWEVEGRRTLIETARD